MDCGYVVVPEARSGDSSREVKLGITRLNSGQGTASSPLFMLAGGPGGVEISPEYLRLFQPELLGGILEARDIVVVKQRGTEYTDTPLVCPEALTAPWDVYEKGLTGAGSGCWLRAVGILSESSVNRSLRIMGSLPSWWFWDKLWILSVRVIV
jgi:hypothetical protein